MLHFNNEYMMQVVIRDIQMMVTAGYHCVVSSEETV